MASSFLGVLPHDDIASVMQHPAQEHNITVVETLIGHLRSCHTFEQYDDFQRALFQLLYYREQHRSESRRCAARLARGKSLPTTLPELPSGANPNDPETWRIEDLVLDRICRQLRAVGDALAWRASEYDRSYIVALSSNDSPGPMAGKAGLNQELGDAVELRKGGSFPLLHDLTNCLRIGDITEFTSGGEKLLHEVKSNPQAKAKGRQLKRMKAAIEAVMEGGELPGKPGTRIVRPSIRCCTHMGSFTAVIRNAQERVIVGAAIPNGRAVTVFSAPALARLAANPPTTDDFSAERQRALEDAGIATATHHVRLASVTRNHAFVPTVTPFALYPLTPVECALLICDFMTFDVTVAPEMLTRHLEREGITTDIPLALANGSLDGTETVISLAKGSRHLRLHPGALYELPWSSWMSRRGPRQSPRSSTTRTPLRIRCLRSRTTQVWR